MLEFGRRAKLSKIILTKILYVCFWHLSYRKIFLYEKIQKHVTERYLFFSEGSNGAGKNEFVPQNT